TVVYQVGDKYRGMPHRHCLLINAEDAKKAGFQEHQRVTVQGDASKLENIEIVPSPNKINSFINQIFNTNISYLTTYEDEYIFKRIGHLNNTISLSIYSDDE
ncbi:MAG: hypothetical protein ACKO90_13200, partial [Microcystis panniformis]